MYSVREASVIIGVKVRTIRAWIKTGKISAFKDQKTNKFSISKNEVERMKGEKSDMAVRNFYIEADVDGYKTMLKGGPRNKEGGMEITLYQRDDGEIVTAYKISCFEKDGKLYSKVLRDEEVIDKFETER